MNGWVVIPRAPALHSGPPGTGRRPMRFRLMPRDEGFYPLFREAADNAVGCATVLLELAARPADAGPLVEKLVESEHRGDELVRAVHDRLDTSIVTPFDREDILALIEEIDRAVDDMRAAGEFIHLHHIEEPHRQRHGDRRGRPRHGRSGVPAHGQAAQDARPATRAGRDRPAGDAGATTSTAGRWPASSPASSRRSRCCAGRTSSRRSRARSTPSRR